MKNKILFLLKKNGGYGYQIGVRSGMYNSVSMLVKQLKLQLNADVHLEIAVDGNEIDKFIHQYNPSIVIIEAIWATGDKVRELTKLHPKVVFIIRIHSEVPFIANEGVAIERIKDYDKIPRVVPAFNSLEALGDFQAILSNQCLYLPNVYDLSEADNVECRHAGYMGRVFNIGCFGAIRPMKNQLLQAIGAIKFADSIGKHLKFHINGTRLEQKGEPVLKNIRALFADSKHDLVEHPWMEREEFLNVVSDMDMGLQLSLTESFNIVTADFISQGVPIVVSPTIEWMPDKLTARDFSSEAMVETMRWAYRKPQTACNAQLVALFKYNKVALKAWQPIV